MDKEIRRLALRQYFKYFRWWFLTVAVVGVFTLAVVIAGNMIKNLPRGNHDAAEERIYDFAGVLSSSDREELEKCIEKYQKAARIDIVLVLTNEPMGVEDAEWEYSMMNRADDIYDEGMYGYNRPYGDGALLLYNWYVDPETGSQKGAWLSTSGKMEDMIGWQEEGRILDALERYIFTDPVKGYEAAIIEMAKQGTVSVDMPFPVGGTLIIPLIVAGIYLLTNLSQVKARNTTTPSLYVADGKPVMKAKRDDFIRKNVVSHRIESNSSSHHSGGHSSHHGGGSHGSHHSSGGHSHGGGGRRH